MPHYFFNLRHTVLEMDHQGLELVDDHAAWGEATKTLGEILRDLDGKLLPGPEWRLEVSNDRDEALFSLRFQAEDYRPQGRQPIGGQTKEG